jgi:hypothetical protein
VLCLSCCNFPVLPYVHMYIYQRWAPANFFLVR